MRPGFEAAVPNPKLKLLDQVSGQWSVVSGQWSVVSGQWSVVGSQWSCSPVTAA